MTWGEIAELSADPLVTIGGHSVSHTALAKMSEDSVRFEMRSSVAIIEAALGRTPPALLLPAWRSSLGGSARVRSCPRAWLQNRRDHSPRRAVPRAPRPFDCATPYQPKRRVPTTSFRPCSAFRRRHGRPEQFSKSRRRLDYSLGMRYSTSRPLRSLRYLGPPPRSERSGPIGSDPTIEQPSRGYGEPARRSARQAA
jgi:peptidoglycan/xylan/chitin deacetylase (PgdA/CDA1 family)